MKKLLTVNIKSVFVSLALFFSVFLFSFFSLLEKFAPLPVATYSIGATVVEMTRGALFNQVTISSLDGRGVTRENIVNVGSTAKFTVQADYFPYMVIVKPKVTNLVPAVYHCLNGRSDTKSKANRVVIGLPSAETTTSASLAVTVLNNVTEAPMVGANVVITNLTNRAIPATELYADANGLVRVSGFAIGDQLSVSVKGMSVDYSYTISTNGLPEKSYITSYAFVTPR